MWKAILMEKKRKTKTMTLSKRKGVITKSKTKRAWVFLSNHQKQAKGVE